METKLTGRRKSLRETYLEMTNREDRELRDVLIDIMDRGWVLPLDPDHSLHGVIGAHEIIVPRHEWPLLLERVSDVVRRAILRGLFERKIALAPTDGSERRLTFTATESLGPSRITPCRRRR